MGLEEMKTSGWEIGTERSVVNNLHRLVVWGPVISSNLDPTQQDTLGQITKQIHTLQKN